MGKRTKLCCVLIAFVTVFYQGNTFAAAEQAAEPKVQENNEAESIAVEKLPPAPVVFEGDDIAFDEATGAVYAKGNVKITQLTAELTADEIRGNTQSADVWIEGKAHITEQSRPKIDLNGYKSHYNYQDQAGTMEKIIGKADDKYVQGEKLEFFPDEIIVYNGTVTKCPAQKPDYHMSARKIEIWPNNKMIAYDAKFWIKGQIIYSTSRYETEIGENKKENNVFPKAGYTSSDGAYLQQTLERPISKDAWAYANLGYYSKHGMRNDYGVILREPRYSLAVETGDFRDDDDNWVKKEPNFHFIYPNTKLGKTPYNYRFNAEYGKWKDDDKTSWHQDYELYFSRDAIKLSDSLKLYLGVGYEMIKESYDKSKINTLKYDATLYQTFSPKISAWTGYHYTENDVASALFNYDTVDVGKELASGISYRFDDKNSIVIAHSYDLENSKVADMDYTWYRDLHCWQASLTYREKRDEWKFKVAVTKW